MDESITVHADNTQIQPSSARDTNGVHGGMVLHGTSLTLNHGLKGSRAPRPEPSSHRKAPLPLVPHPFHATVRVIPFLIPPESY